MDEIVLFSPVNFILLTTQSKGRYLKLQSVTKMFWTVASQPTSNPIFRGLLR